MSVDIALGGWRITSTVPLARWTTAGPFDALLDFPHGLSRVPVRVQCAFDVVHCNWAGGLGAFGLVVRFAGVLPCGRRIQGLVGAQRDRRRLSAAPVLALEFPNGVAVAELAPAVAVRV